MDLRDYQHLAVRGSFDRLREGQTTLIVLPTGCGKTVVFSEIIRYCVGRGKRAMVVAHREELIDQAASKIKAIAGIEPDKEMAEFRAPHGFGKSKVVVASIQTLNSGVRLQRFDPTEFGLLVIDEAHHSTAASYITVITYFTHGNPACKVLGVTATPNRADEAALGQVFESVAFQYGILDAINGGYLVPIRQELIPVESIDLSRCRTTAGDLNGADLARELEAEEPLHGVVKPTVEIAGDRKTLLFAASIKHAHRMAEMIDQRYKPGTARVVTGTTPRDERKAMFAAYANRDFQFLVNVGVATEGFDDPGIEVVAVARPTKSTPLYTQMIGRGTRVLPGVIEGLTTAEDRRSAIAASGKPSMLVLDYVGNSGKHKLVHCADALGGEYPDEVVEEAERAMAESGEETDVVEALRQAEEKVEEEKKQAEEAARASARQRRGIVADVKYGRQEVDPFEILDVRVGREPGWFKGKEPTAKMVAALHKFKIPNPESMSFHQARRMLDECIERARTGKCTFAQARQLKKYGHDTDASFEQARVILDGIFGNRRAVGEPA